MYTPTPLDPARREIALELIKALRLNESDYSAPAPSVNLSRVLLAMAEGRALSERDASVVHAAQLLAGTRIPLGAYSVPWGASRAMATTPGAKGGYAVGVSVGPMADAMRPYSVAIAAGARVLDNLTDSIQLPRVATKGTGRWVAEGSAPSGDTEPVHGAVSAVPREVIATGIVSLQLLREPAAEPAISDSLFADVGEAIDIAVAAGAGGTQPLGIVNTTGVGVASGTSITWAGVAAMRQTVLDAGAREADLFVIAAANVQKLLSTREKASGSGFIWSNGTIDGIPARASKHVPDGTLILGSAGQLVIASWGPGPVFATSQSTGFNTAAVDVRVLAYIDVCVLQPSAFVIAQSVT